MRFSVYLLTVFACFAGAIGGALFYYFTCSRKVLRKASLLSHVAKRINELRPCEMENLDAIDSFFDSARDDSLKAAFARFQIEAARLLGNETAPEASGYFTFKSIYAMPDDGSWFRIFRVISGAYGLFAALIPPAWILLAPTRVAHNELFVALGVSALTIMWFAAVYMIVTALGHKAYLTARMALEAIESSLRYALPTAGDATVTALLLKSARQNGVSFAESSAMIAAKIDSFVVDSVAPVATRAFVSAIDEYIRPILASMDGTLASLSEAILEKQENGLRILADRFGEQLYSVTSARMTELCETIETVNTGLSGLNAEFGDFAGQIRLGLEEDRATLSTVAGLSLQTAEAQRHSSESIREFSERLSEIRILSDSLSARLDSMSKAQELMTENLTKVVISVTNALRKAMDSNADTAAKLGITIDALANAGSEQYEKAARAAASLLENIVTEINKAMDGVGKEISESIGKATGESAEIVGRLTEQTMALKQEYDGYFTRVDEQNRRNYDELDFHMQNVTARFSDEAIAVISKLQESISDAMGLFEGNTASLLSNLDEQSRAIGLYAKELAFDVSSLSTNLRESVAEFSEHVRQGVAGTFEEFDEGLSEVSKRLANTVESIRDSVENLPKTLSALGENKQ